MSGKRIKVLTYRRTVQAAASGIMIVLAACATDEPEVVAAGDGSVSVVERPIEPASPQAASDAVPPPPGPRPDGRKAQPRRTVQPSEPEGVSGSGPEATPSNRPFSALVGLADDDLRRELGSPDSIIDQPPATVWTYRMNGCDLKLFLFRDVAEGDARALTFKVEPAQPEGAADSRCSAALASRLPKSLA